MSDTPIIFSTECNEPDGKVIHYVKQLILTKENIQQFWDKAKQFPSLYGKQILNDPESFAEIFMRRTNDGSFDLNGILWVIDDFLGVFYISDILFDRDTPISANVHYTFFDRRHKGRMPLVKEMLKYVFRRYHFRRLTAEIPNYSKDSARHFVVEAGFYYEGKKRKAALYKGDYFDINMYGILREEVLENGST